MKKGTEFRYAQCRLYTVTVKERVMFIKGAFELDKNRNIELREGDHRRDQAPLFAIYRKGILKAINSNGIPCSEV
jgi:hypothetical protein